MVDPSIDTATKIATTEAGLSVGKLVDYVGKVLSIVSFFTSLFISRSSHQLTYEDVKKALKEALKELRDEEQIKTAYSDAEWHLNWMRDNIPTVSPKYANEQNLIRIAKDFDERCTQKAYDEKGFFGRPCNTLLGEIEQQLKRPRGKWSRDDFDLNLRRLRASTLLAQLHVSTLKQLLLVKFILADGDTGKQKISDWHYQRVLFSFLNTLNDYAARVLKYTTEIAIRRILAVSPVRYTDPPESKHGKFKQEDRLFISDRAANKRVLDKKLGLSHTDVYHLPHLAQCKKFRYEAWRECVLRALAATDMEELGKEFHKAEIQRREHIATVLKQEYLELSNILQTWSVDAQQWTSIFDPKIFGGELSRDPIDHVTEVWWWTILDNLHTSRHGTTDLLTTKFILNIGATGWPTIPHPLPVSYTIPVPACVLDNSESKLERDKRISDAWEKPLLQLRNDINKVIARSLEQLHPEWKIFEKPYMYLPDHSTLQRRYKEGPPVREERIRRSLDKTRVLNAVDIVMFKPGAKYTQYHDSRIQRPVCRLRTADDACFISNILLARAEELTRWLHWSLEQNMYCFPKGCEEMVCLVAEESDDLRLGDEVWTFRNRKTCKLHKRHVIEYLEELKKDVSADLGREIDALTVRIPKIVTSDLRKRANMTGGPARWVRDYGGYGPVDYRDRELFRWAPSLPKLHAGPGLPAKTRTSVGEPEAGR
ncbi:MAG: hypothetical protein GTN78_03675 [Gemmatimonadales bacterium]|nr:hypothetical protein [Gemmatimonadales bacterium]NIQ99285.1 hypothetical protein [Gemmatimonadales bacterium]